MLRADGGVIEDYADMTYMPLVLLSDLIRTPQEKRLGKLVKEKYNTDFCMLTKS